MSTAVRPEQAAHPKESSRFAGRRVHFIGIGGCGMSGLARILLDAGAIVTGTDSKPNELTLELSRRGATISYEQRGEQLHASIDLVVRTAAVRDENPEFQRAIELGLETIKYAELLGRLMAEKTGIAVGGTHGKTTTTSMIAFALHDCGLDPSFVIGGHVPQFGASSRSGRGELFVAEACEYDRSFLHLRPKVAVITNVEAEHLDVYKDLDEIVETFVKFARLVPADGTVVIGGGDAGAKRVIEQLGGKVKTYGIGEGFDYCIEPTGVVLGCHHGIVRVNGEVFATIRPGVAGRHNLLNATAALAACVAAGARVSSAADAVGRFLGAERRMSEVGRFNGAILVDDYGHHPTEVRATLTAIREKYQPQRLICVFQPHQYNRTRHLLDDFATSFDSADETIVPEIYAVRDTADDRAAVSSRDLVDKLSRRGRRATHVPTFDEAVAVLKQTARAGDVILTMGAGNVDQVGRQLLAS